MSLRHRISSFLKKLGPGIVTGAADDDPSGIGTYSQTGAQFGYRQLWLALYTLPLMIAVQESCASIGAVTGRGLASVIKEVYGRKIVYLLVLLVLFANTLNIGADLGAMAAATNLIIPLPTPFLAVLFAVGIVLLEIFLSYKTYSRILRLLALSLLAYPVSVFLIREPWSSLVKATLVPHLELNFPFLFIVVGVLGTTISPYLFFWQASQEVEEKKLGSKPRLLLKNLRLDTFLGMLFSNFTTWCIIVIAATVLHGNGVTDIKTASDAARTLEPLVNSFPNAGFIAKILFASGIVGLGLLGIPVLAGASAYAVSETLNWSEGLNLKLKKAHGFYGVIIASTFVGLFLNFIGIDPIKALVYAAVFNGISAVPLLFFIGKLASNPHVMGSHTGDFLTKTLVWITFVVMFVSAISLLFLK